MTRLIDADALKAEWYRMNDIDENDRGARFIGYTEITRWIDRAPTIEPTGDLISRQAAIDAIRNRIEKSEVGESVDHDQVIADLESLPSAPDSRQRGEWSIEECECIYGTKYILTCSECGESVSVTENALPYEKYCRNCGARMRGGEDDDCH